VRALCLSELHPVLWISNWILSKNVLKEKYVQRWQTSSN
jgi:hypothetical protein